MKYSLIVVCRGNEASLAQTLPRNLAKTRGRDDVEIVVLNYHSPGDCLAIVNRFEEDLQAGRLVYAEERTATGLRLCHAKNVGHRLGEGQFLASMRADDLIGDDFLQVLDYDVDHQGSKLIGLSPRLVIDRDLFAAVHGYDERFVGWGYDDQDLFDRARAFMPESAPVRRPLPSSDSVDPQQSTRNGPGTDGEGKSPVDTYRANQSLSQEALKSGKLVANPGGYGKATVFVNFDAKGQALA